MKSASNNSFLVFEKLTDGVRKETLENGWKYRNEYAKNDKMDWYKSVDRTGKGVIIFYGSYSELQEYCERDPLCDVVTREINPLQVVAYAQRSKIFPKGEPKPNKDFEMSIVNIDSKDILMGTDTNY